VRPGGTHEDAVDAAAWLNAHDAADLPEAEIGAPVGSCAPSPDTEDEPDQAGDDSIQAMRS
jgi:hypothetical protein